jgi:cyclic pyranopterin monophosphate synthase
MEKFSHTDPTGKANMVDIGHKPEQARTAKAEGFIQLSGTTVELIKQNHLKKGDVLTVAEIAGIQAAKNTALLIPLCHNILIDEVEVNTTLEPNGVKVVALAKCSGKTGIEMEALTAVSITLLTIYDMCKAVDKAMVITDIRLVEKVKI